MIKRKTNQLITLYGTNDPFEIAARLNILVLFETLGNIYGFFNTSRRIRMIHINDELCDWLKRFVCAHELGHALLHPDVNTPFLRRNTLFSIDRIEKEANQFAVELLMPDCWIQDNKHDYSTIQDMATACGIPSGLVHLKHVA
nr:ImmA/IrrE family metallo-endopeptidase [Aneurinibacillus sp. XH2]